MKKVCVMGLGYIGLPTASLLATKGFQVQGVDCIAEVVNTINHGKIHIIEPSLDILVKSAVQSGNLRASVNPEEADVFIISVPTPFKDNHVPDLSYVQAATEAISPCIQPGNLIILESTSPVGTTEKIREWIKLVRPELFPIGSEEKVHIAHCPERVLPGQILRELVENDRIIGGIDKASAQKAGEFYKQFVQGEILLTDSRTAEMSKLTENSFRDVNIAFANELSLICDNLGIDVWKLITLANRHPRVNILNPGPGVGGHCIAVDPWFIVDAAPEEAKLIRTARFVNDNKPAYVVQRIQNKANRFRKPIVACLGLSFKADIDDLRESPAMRIVEALSEVAENKILVVEPHIMELPPQLACKDNVLLVSIERALEDSDIISLLVDHRTFKGISSETLKDKVIIDTRGIWK